MEHNASKPILACNGGKVAKSADAQSPNTVTCYNGWLHKQESLLNKGSLYICFVLFFLEAKLNRNKSKDKDL